MKNAATIYTAPLFKFILNQHQFNIQTYFSKNLYSPGVKNNLPCDQQNDVSNKYNECCHIHPRPRNLDGEKYLHYLIVSEPSKNEVNKNSKLNIFPKVQTSTLAHLLYGLRSPGHNSVSEQNSGKYAAQTQCVSQTQKPGASLEWKQIRMIDVATPVPVQMSLMLKSCEHWCYLTLQTHCNDSKEMRAPSSPNRTTENRFNMQPRMSNSVRKKPEW